MILNIRGTHGSGKSTIVRNLIDRYGGKPCQLDQRDKPLVYCVRILKRRLTYVIGGYENACGGCDAIQPYDRIWPLVETYAKQGSVIFEGALVSSSYGNIGRSSEAFGNKFVFCFLTTPLSVCLERIQLRRLSKGNTKPLDPKNTKVKYDNIQRSIPKIRDEFKRRIVMLNWQHPLPQLLGLLNEK